MGRRTGSRRWRGSRWTRCTSTSRTRSLWWRRSWSATWGRWTPFSTRSSGRRISPSPCARWSRRPCWPTPWAPSCTGRSSSRYRGSGPRQGQGGRGPYRGGASGVPGVSQSRARASGPSPGGVPGRQGGGGRHAHGRAGLPRLLEGRVPGRRAHRPRPRLPVARPRRGSEVVAAAPTFSFSSGSGDCYSVTLTRERVPRPRFRRIFHPGTFPRPMARRPLRARPRRPSDIRSHVHRARPPPRMPPAPQEKPGASSLTAAGRAPPTASATRWAAC